jgi:L-amino acid N-acyltransferase YncA
MVEIVCSIEEASVPDAEEIAPIFAHYATTSVVTFETTPLPAESWAERIRSVRAAGLPFLVLVRDGEVRGFGYAAPWRPKPAYRHTVEVTIYLHPDDTGRGYGRRLLADLLARCADAGARQAIAVIADSGSAASERLHQAAGFAVVGRLSRVGHKHGRWVDTILMQRELAATG